MGVVKCHGACARMEEGNVTNNLNYLFPGIKGGHKIDCELSTRTFFCCKWYQYRGVFLTHFSPVSHFYTPLFWGYRNVTLD